MTASSRDLPRTPVLRSLACLLAASLLPGASAGPLPAPSPRAALAQTASPYAAAPAPGARAEAIEEARRIAEELRREAGIPGLSVAVAAGGEVVWAEGFGWASMEHRAAVWPFTRFRIGSVSKTLTSVALGLLVEEGKLDLDAPVRRYVPYWPEKRWPVTTRQLAGHLAGVRHYRDGEFLSRDRYQTVREGVDIFADDTLLFEPGTEYSYSSYGWNLLSAVVEGAGEESYLSYMRSRVLEPMDLAGAVADHPDSIVWHRTEFYRRGEDGRLLNAPYVDNSYKWAGGGYLSTPTDLARFGLAVLASLDPEREGILEPETVRALWRSQETASGEETDYGMGWRTYDEYLEEAKGGTEEPEREDERDAERPARDGGGAAASGLPRLVGHGGGSVGGTTAFLLWPREGVVVAVTANLSDAELGEVPMEIGRLFHSAGDAAEDPPPPRSP